MTQHVPFSNHPIFIGALAESLPEWLKTRNYSQVFLLADVHTDRLCRSLLPVEVAGAYTIGEHMEQALLTKVHGMEVLKTIQSCEAIWQAMFEARLDRKALIINLGGGVVGDMGGFCAATYKRGIDFVQVPTTLLAMTDAAIGGKLGVDFNSIKNAVGVFQNPAAVFIDPFFLKTLPERELRSGFAEVIKHALIGDRTLWQRIQTMLVQSLSATAWDELLEASIAVKTKIVSEDPREAGIRALLNFGHTIGHALESFFLQTEQPLTHGEAIAIGMLCESPEDTTATLAQTILRFFPHRQIPESAFPALWKLMEQDKKNTSGTVRMAVPDAEPFSMQWQVLEREEAYRRLWTYNGLNFSN